MRIKDYRADLCMPLFIWKKGRGLPESGSEAMWAWNGDNRIRLCCRVKGWGVKMGLEKAVNRPCPELWKNRA